MSRCWDGGCSKVNYAAYVKKNMPHNTDLHTGIPDLYLHKMLLYNKLLEITLDGGKNMRHN